jgi:hypothetical protein
MTAQKVAPGIWAALPRRCSRARRAIAARLFSLIGVAVATSSVAGAQTSSAPTDVAPASPPPAVGPTVVPFRPLAVPAWREPDSGVAVYTAVDDDLFPVPWRGESIAASAAPPAPLEALRALRVLRIALRKYPAALLRANLERVHIVGDLRFQGIRAAGTNSATRIYIKVEPNNPLYTDAFLEESFHHEFAHMLRRNFSDRWDEAAWSAANPLGFRYGASSGVEAVKAGKTSLWFSDEWNRKGFLSEYAATDPSEDFATVGGSLFTGDPLFWPTVDRYPALQAKVRAAVAFYGRIDPALTEAYFRAQKAGVAPTAPPSAPPPLPVPAPPRADLAR